MKYYKSLIAFALSLLLLFGGALPAFAAEKTQTVTTILSLTQAEADGSRLNAEVLVTDADGNPVTNSTAKVTLHLGTLSNSQSLDANGIARPYRSNVSAKEYDVYAEFLGDSKYNASQSAHVTINVVKQTLAKADITTSPSVENQSTGTISVAGNVKYLDYTVGGQTRRVEGSVITGLAAGEYYVYIGAFQEDNTYYLRSSSQRVKVEETEAVYHTVTFAGEHVTWYDEDDEPLRGSIQAAEVARTVLQLETDSGYTLTDVTAEPQDAAQVDYQPRHGTVTLLSVKKDFTLIAVAEDQRAEATVTLTVDQSSSNEQAAVISVSVTDANGSPVKPDGRDADIQIVVNGSTGTYTLDENGQRTVSKTLRTGENTIYAVFLASDDYKESRSTEETITVVKTDLAQDAVSATDSYLHRAAGSITVQSEYPAFAYYKAQTGNTVVVNGSTATGLEAGTYYVLIPAYRDGSTFYLASNRVSVTIGAVPEFHYTVTTAGEHAVWSEQSLVLPEDGSAVLTVSAEDGYLISGVSAEPAGKARISFDAQSGEVTIAQISGDFTLRTSYRWQSDENDAYTVTLTPDERIAWSRSGSVKIKYGSSGSIYVAAADEERYYIESVAVSPEGRAEVHYSSTGEVFITGILSDITLTAQVVDRNPPTSLLVDYDFVTGGNSSETNPAVAVDFSVTELAAEGSVVPGTKIYLRADEADVSYAQARETDAQGVALFHYVYTIEKNETTADYLSLFAFDTAFETFAAQPLHLVQQRNRDLVLYDSQIIAATPGESNGKVIDVPDNYELYTGEIHQGAIVSGGIWVHPTDGTFSGLSVGQHAVRAAEYADKATGTFYLKSDYAVFTVPRGVWTVEVDTAESAHVVFDVETSYNAEPGGTVYVFAAPEEGYEITSYSVNHPNYVDAITYDVSQGSIVLEGVTGSVVLTVTATEIPQEEPPVEPTPDVPADGNICPICGKTEHEVHWVGIVHAVFVFVRSLLTEVLPGFVKVVRT